MPRPNTALVDSRAADLSNRFTFKADIIEVSQSSNEFGDVIEVTSTLYSDVPAVLAAISAQGEVRRPNDTIVYRAWAVILDGDYDFSGHGYKIVIDDHTYNVLRVIRSSVRKLTRVECEEVI